MEKPSGDEHEDVRPRPDDFLNYLPWACNQLQLAFTLLINKVFQNDYVCYASTSDRIKKTRSKIKLSQSRYDVNSDQEKEKSSSAIPQVQSNQKVIKITAVFDNMNELVEIKFLKNKILPRTIFKVIGLILQFYPNLAKIDINRGMDKYTVYEINSFLSTANITELCFDGSFLKEANFDILLDAPNFLRYLSLSRCQIDDFVLENIAKKLTISHPASTKLNILNLSSNRITDLGVEKLAQALRSNRSICYINLADNSITDEGAYHLFDVLTEFPLSCNEIYQSKSRYMTFLKDKHAMITRVMRELRSEETDRKTSKRKSTRAVSSSRKNKLDKESSLKSVVDGKSLVDFECLFYDRAVNIAEERLGEFNDPFAEDNVILKEDVLYCKGNNAVCYLNLAYNDLSYLSLKKILDILMVQKLQDRRPRGLINLLIEGNNLPVSCNEMTQIDDLLEMGIMVHNRRLSGTKKRPQSKTASTSK